MSQTLSLHMHDRSVPLTYQHNDERISLNPSRRAGLPMPININIDHSFPPEVLISMTTNQPIEVSKWPSAPGSLPFTYEEHGRRREEDPINFEGEPTLRITGAFLQAMTQSWAYKALRKTLIEALNTTRERTIPTVETVERVWNTPYLTTCSTPGQKEVWELTRKILERRNTFLGTHCQLQQFSHAPP
ncbi:uncharacterized protein BT62DRAFT_1008821 [Guyanagaster necrorhizus]|uniref:Uncharacterized protein n=1 Tax=Guyanagaster necrorhizus TaxID=856835 RepID=A0A9P7VPP6_9AGAR|nr:uncharacterized protein BT62DRAFT_1008821 [Guyanagaster necrorhizus MCA 3950]KAG7443756.1 hypothetical protein BT62DRAFT_1008821 [Guyanagaster necrorhizus MCA 3950]